MEGIQSGNSLWGKLIAQNGKYLDQRFSNETQNVLSIGSTVNETTEEVTLEFLARRVGHDVVYFTLYGPNLDSASHNFGVLVKA